MTALCIHGFLPAHCGSCRTCPHGLMTSHCGRCLAATTSAGYRRLAATAGPQPQPVEHQGFEIFWAPAVSGWQYRAPDSVASRESFRSVFLARKAIDRLVPSKPG